MLLPVIFPGCQKPFSAFIAHSNWRVIIVRQASSLSLTYQKVLCQTVLKIVFHVKCIEAVEDSGVSRRGIGRAPEGLLCVKNGLVRNDISMTVDVRAKTLVIN